MRRASPAEPASEQDGGEVQKSLQGFGYSNQDNYNTLSLLRATEFCGDCNTNRPDRGSMDQLTFRNDGHQKYKRLVRRLPSQTVVNSLVQTYLTLVNWQYDLLDGIMFQEQLKAWWNVSYVDLQENLTTMAAEVLVFPALLFQVLAQALLFHSPRDKTITDLLIMPNMTYHDLAVEYSDTGADVLALLGKGGITTTTIQAGLLHASFLKSSGKVIEAWHTLGATIRDAQEIGLHTGRNGYEQYLRDPEGEMQCLSVAGHKLWMVLHIWDAHMAVVLGRPMATNLQLDSFAHTIGDEKWRRELLLHWQTEDEPPRPFDVIMAGYTVAYRYFQDIHHLEHDGTNPEHKLAVEHIHATIISNLEILPSWCRLENPSTKFDSVYGCEWLPAAREGLYSLIHLVLLTLHRPHVFSDSNSRVEALKAGTSILCAQERLFKQSESHRWNIFTPVYASFDAIVLIAAICLGFPDEDREQRVECIQVVARGIQMLEIIGRSNYMAQSAHGVASSLYHRLMHRLGIPESTDSADKMISSSKQIFPESRRKSPDPAFTDPSFEAISPPCPIHDLFDDHLSSAQTSSSGRSDRLPMDSFVENITGNWNFEGDFSDDSFWGFLNELDYFT